MPIPLIVNKIEEINEGLREYYTEKDGTFYLDVDGGAVSKKDYDDLNEKHNALTSLAKAPDGKTYKEMFEGSQTANHAIRQERDTALSELKKWQALGNISDVQSWRDELDGYKANGSKLNEAQQQIAELKKANREYFDKENELKTEIDNLKNQNIELTTFKAETTKQLDLADAETKIATVVDGIQGANARALKLNLRNAYKNGELVRDNDSNLVSADGKLSLVAFANEQMEAYGLYARNTPGASNPPDRQPYPQTVTHTTPSSIAAMLH